MTSGPSISVVVCSLDGASTLRRCLDALAAQTVAAMSELIFVDDGSTDATPDVFRRWQAETEVRFQRCVMVQHGTNRGLSAARNTGVETSTAPLVAFTDDDCAPDADWLGSLAGLLGQPEVAVGGGPVRPLTTDTFVRRYLARNNPLEPLDIALTESQSLLRRGIIYLRSNLPAAVSTERREVYSVVGANFGVPRPVLDRLGGFDEHITFAGEEEDLCRRAREAQLGRILFDPAPIVAHDFEPGLGDTLRRSYAYGRGSARNWLRRPEQGPAVYPFPVLVAALLLVGRGRKTRLGVALLPVLLYPKHLLRRDAPTAARLVHPYIQLLEEAADDVGFLAGWKAFRARYRHGAES